MQMSTIAPTVHGLFELVLLLDPAEVTWESLQERARAKVDELEQDVARLRERLEAVDATEALHDALESAAANLRELSEALEHSAGAEQWRRLYAALAQNYEQLVKAAEALPERFDTPFSRLNRKNYLRNAFHIAGGISAAFIQHFLLTRTQTLWVISIIFGMCALLELLRHSNAGTNELLMRFWFFRKIARPHEYYRVNSSTWYAFGLVLIAAAFDQVAVAVACVVLAVADPVASNLGRRFGKKKIFRSKSWVGSGAFFVTAAVVSATYLALFTGLAPIAIAGLALAAAFGGTLAELFAVGVDDNFAVPVVTALSVWLAAPLL